MWRYSVAFLVLLREIIFDSKEEYDLTHPKFSFKKVSLYLLVLFSVLSSLYFSYRSVRIATDLIYTTEVNRKMQVKLQNLEKYIDSDCASVQKRIDPKQRD